MVNVIASYSRTLLYLILENEVDGESFLLLTDDDISQMIKPLGVRRKLISIRNALNSVISDMREDDDDSALQPNSACASLVTVGLQEDNITELQDESKEIINRVERAIK